MKIYIQQENSYLSIFFCLTKIKSFPIYKQQPVRRYDGRRCSIYNISQNYKLKRKCTLRKTFKHLWTIKKKNKHLNQWKDVFLSKEDSTLIISNHPQEIYKFHTVPIKTDAGFPLDHRQAKSQDHMGQKQELSRQFSVRKSDQTAIPTRY